MNDEKFFNELLTKIFPSLRREYDLVMAKKRLKYVERYRDHLLQRIKELENLKSCDTLNEKRNKSKN